LIVPCEVAVKAVVPAMRALIAKELLEKYDMKQKQVAQILGISQSAVSKYAKETRGHAIRIEEMEAIRPSINTIIHLLINGTDPRTEVLRLLCQTCAIIREQGLMCEFCQKTEPTIDLETCNFCLPQSTSKRNI
jgi:predicted transcriptional regulator